MKWGFVVLGLVVLSTSMVTDALAVQKSSGGVACNSTGTARKDGKDQDGNKLNCQWDTCTYCGTTNGTIDCSKQITEYSNPTDCHAVKAIFGGNQSVFTHGNLQFSQDSKPTPNTGGGELSNFYMWGMTPMAEAIVQTRGSAGERQQEKHDLVLLTGNGGILDPHASLLLSPNAG